MADHDSKETSTKEMSFPTSIDEVTQNKVFKLLL